MYREREEFQREGKKIIREVRQLKCNVEKEINKPYEINIKLKE
jgi:hypothetical protein